MKTIKPSQQMSKQKNKMRGEPPHNKSVLPFINQKWGLLHYNKALHTKGAKIIKMQKSPKCENQQKPENAKTQKVRKWKNTK